MRGGSLLSALINARAAYENAFLGQQQLSSPLIERLPDRDLELSGHVFIANAADRRIQITIDDAGNSSAFIKLMGIRNEVMLLQIIVSLDDLQIDMCKQLFELWLVAKISPSSIEALIEQVGTLPPGKPGH